MQLDDRAKQMLDSSTFAFNDATPPQNHSGRVTVFTIALARAFGLEREQIAVIARGAHLHDIGKMAIPDVILCKPAKLDPDEIAEMRETPVSGLQDDLR
jgi:cyclic di-GMP phosphodiesterase